MLQYFYQWLVWKSSSPNDVNHQCWQIVDEYLALRPSNPTSLQAFWKFIQENEYPTLIAIVGHRLDLFIEGYSNEGGWYMEVRGSGFRFIEASEIKNSEVPVVLVYFGLDYIKVMEYVN